MRGAWEYISTRGTLHSAINSPCFPPTFAYIQRFLSVIQSSSPDQSSMMRYLLTVSLALVATVGGNPSEPIVDLGYSSYRGYYNTTTGLNIWKGCAATCPISTSTKRLLIPLRAEFAMRPLQSTNCDGNPLLLLLGIPAIFFQLLTSRLSARNPVPLGHRQSMASTRVQVTRTVCI